jgi:hypothetical protein
MVAAPTPQSTKLQQQQHLHQLQLQAQQQYMMQQHMVMMQQQQMQQQQMQYLGPEALPVPSLPPLTGAGRDASHSPELAPKLAAGPVPLSPAAAAAAKAAGIAPSVMAQV